MITHLRYPHKTPYRAHALLFLAAAALLTRCDVDTTSSGTASVTHPQIRAASAAPTVSQETKERCADALTWHLVAWYAESIDPLEELGGLPLRCAACGLDPERLEDVTDTALDPTGPDKEGMRILAHPDVVFPGSDILLYCIVDPTSAIVETLHFN